MHFQIEFRNWVAQNKIPREQYIKLRSLMQTGLGIVLPSVRGQAAYLQKTTEIQPQFVDCCQSGCMAYTGQFASLRSCSFCGSPRYRENDSVNPIQQYLYIPLAKRLEIQYSDRERSKVLKEYRTTLLRTYKEGQYRDVWDGNLFQDYHKKLGMFKKPTDIGLQLSLDGVQVVQRRNFLVTPVILLNLNLPPSERVRIQNILVSILIPGPHEPKNLDSFLYPLVQEMHVLGKGIPGVIDGQYLSGTAGYKFTLRAWITLVTGDGPATAKVMGFKSPGNAKAPCRMCYQQAQRPQTSNTYYVPHNGIYSGFDMRCDARRDIQLCVEADKDDLYSQWGITRKSILTELRSIHFPRSFPIDMMHCVLLNITPLLFRLWIGKVPGIDNENNKPAYRLSSKDLSSIGDTLVNAISTTPAALGHAPRSISKHYNGFKAAEWKAWLTLYGTPCLRPYLPDEYLQNFVVLGHLFTLATKQQLSQSEVDLIEGLCTSFLQSYELLYYQNNERRMKLCTVNFHYLMHLRQHLMDAGPACYWWQFPMERYCGTIVPMARSKSRISQSLMNALIITEHLNHYNFVIPTQLSGKSTPPLPYLTNPISKPVSAKTISKHPSWRSDIYRKYKRPSEDLEPLHVEFYLKCQLSKNTSIGCTSQTRRVNSRANWVVCYSDKRHGFRFGEVEIFALVNGEDAWARIEHLGSSPPKIDRKRRLISYKGPRGKLVWAPVSCIHAAAGVIVLDRHYCITDHEIYASAQVT